MKRTWLVAAMGAVISGFLMLPAQAAPATGVAGDLKAAASESTGIQKVHSRRYRYRHYRRHRHRWYRHLWYRPGFYVHFGHRRHHHHHRGYRRW
jgi:hypothetical protein